MATTATKQQQSNGVYRAYGGPVAGYSGHLAGWERKEELKAHKIALFVGETGLEDLQKWFRSVEHYGLLTGYSKQQAIEKSWRVFTAEVFDKLKLMLRLEYGVTGFPPQRFPFGRPELKARMESAYTSVFSGS